MSSTLVPISSDLARTQAGLPAFMWDASKDVFLGVLPRYGSGGDVRRLHHAGDGCGFQEPVFVPRTPQAPEGDGYLVLVRNRLAEMRSELVILDVASLEAPPLAVVPMPVRLRDAIHGSWVPA